MPVTQLKMTTAKLIERYLASDGGGEGLWLLDEGLAGPGGPEELLLALKSAAEYYWTVDPHVSFRLGEALTWAAGRAARADHRALGLMAEADALRYLGRYAEAMTSFEEAASEFRRLGDEVGWARTRIGWVLASYYVGAAKEALPVAAQAQAVLVRHGEWFRAAALDLNTASVYRRLGRHPAALRLYDEALTFYEHARAAGPAFAEQVPLKMALVTANKANILTLLGDFSAALELHEQAQQVFVAHADVVSALRQQHNIAQVFAGRGHYTHAMRLLTDGLADAERASLVAVALEIMLDLIDCYLALNRDSEALDLANEAIEQLERCGTPTEAAQARFYSALAYARLGDTHRGLELLSTAAGVFRGLGLTSSVAMVALARAGLFLAQGDWEATWNEAREAHALFVSQGLSVRQAQAELVQARAALGLNDHAQAARLAKRALATTRRRAVLWLAHESHHVLATVARYQGDPSRANAEYERAMGSIERMQAGLATDLRSNFLADKLQVYEDAIDYSLELGDRQRAFEHLERAKVRALVDYLARNPEVRIRAGAREDQQLLDELARLRDEHTWFYNRLYGHRIGEGPDSQSAEARTLQTSVRDREIRIARLFERLALRAADEQVLVMPRRRGESVLPPLEDGAVMLEFYLREESGAVFVVTKRGIQAVEKLAIGARTIRRSVRTLHLAMDASAHALAAGNSIDAFTTTCRGLLRSLYQALLAPVAAALAGAQDLVMIPYGPLHGVPFAALHDGSHYLVETHTVSTCSSSRLLRLCTVRPRRPGSRALVLANSNGGQLPYVLREAELIGELLGGEVFVEEQATRTVLARLAGSYPIIHLAAHGEARLDNPQFGYVQLADGQLNTVDAFNLPLDGAIVTLSACETGLTGVSAGDELSGLSRGFLHAGASTLVESLWRVQDRATARLMERFYRGLRSGQRCGTALRLAQLDALAVNGGHPLFWAPFQLVGDALRTWV